MLSNMPLEIQRQMHCLEMIDAKDRIDGTMRMKRLRQIPPETGHFLAILAAGAPRGKFVEIGTSAGYSSLYLALACRAVGAKLVTFELLEEKARLAEETFRKAKVNDVVELVVGDALENLGDFSKIAFCFLDAEKEAYQACYEQVIPNMVKGGILVADNVTSHQTELKPFVDRALADERVDAVVLPIGKGELLCRRS
ncbi:MAG: DUF1442 domain-containing protein [candidate division Zixibacteria bacterium]|nr:DUF1442 domain-containing protein [candidate division Zixibacteria bacterium]